MSHKNGMAALRLEMPDTVPRTEYSADSHWELIGKVTGIEITDDSSGELRKKAVRAFVRAWDYGMVWSILTHSGIFGDKRTVMGHAAYNVGGTDFSAQVSRLFEDPEDVYAYDMFEAYGVRDKTLLAEEYNRHYEEQRLLWPDAVAMTGIYVTCMSGLIELLGWETLLYAASDHAAFGAFVDRHCDWILQYFEALARCAAPVVMVHDDIVWGNGPFLHPDFYRRYIFPNYRRLLRPLHEAGKIVLYTCDGDYTAFVDDVAACGVSGFVMEPGTDMAYVAEKYGRTHAFVGNANTNVLLRGSKEEIEAEVRRCMDIGKRCPGFFMAVGNHIPPNTPVESVLYYNEIYRKYAER